MNESRNGIVTAGFVLGIIGIVCSFIPIVNNLAFVMGILAIIFGLIGSLKSVERQSDRGTCFGNSVVCHYIDYAGVIKQCD